MSDVVLRVCGGCGHTSSAGWDGACPQCGSVRSVFLHDREGHQNRAFRRALCRAALGFGAVLIVWGLSELVRQHGLRWNGYGHLHISGARSGHIATFTLSSWVISTLILTSLSCGVTSLLWGLRGTWLDWRR